MRNIAILCLLSLFLSACANDSGDLVDKERSITGDLNSSEKTLSEEELAAEAKTKKAAEAKRIATESTAALTQLTTDLEAETKDWQAKFEAASTKQDKETLLKTRPQTTFAKQFIELAQKYPGTPVANSAWNLAVQNGTGETKDLATQSVLDQAKNLTDETETQKQFVFLMTKGSGPARDEAMGILFQTAEKDIESAESFDLLKQIVQTPVGNAPKSNAIKRLKQFVDADKESEKACECLDLIYRHGPISSRSSAMQDLLDSHINHDRMINITSELAENVNQNNEVLIQEICEKANGKAQANALITLSKFYANRKEAKQGIATLDEEELKQLNPEQVKYLQADHDTGPVTQLVTKLSTYVDTHAPLIESAKAQLITLESLTAEPKAAEPKAAEPKAAEPKQ